MESGVRRRGKSETENIIPPIPEKRGKSDAFS
jgi:hypothetical protein